MPDEFPKDIGALNAIEDRAAEIKAKLPTALHADGGLKIHVLNPGDIGGAVPTGAATSLKQDTEIASLASIDDKLDDLQTTLDALAVPENEEVVALASGIDTANGRITDALVNKYWRGIAVYFDVTGKNGTGVFVSLSLHLLDSQGAMVTSLFSLDASGMDDVGGYAFWFYPLAPGVPVGNNWKGYAPTPVPRNYRLHVISTTDAVGNDLTYSAKVVYML